MSGQVETKEAEMAKKDGGAAFPAEYYSPETFMELRTTEGVFKAREMATGVSQGMSLRDWFAGQALVSAGATVEAQPGATLEDVATELAKVSYLVADAMLAEREKDNG